MVVNNQVIFFGADEKRKKWTPLCLMKKKNINETDRD